MSGALAVGGSGAGADCCDSPHPTTSTAAVVVRRRCFISLQLSILQPSRWFDWLSLANDFPLAKREKERPGT